MPQYEKHQSAFKPYTIHWRSFLGTADGIASAVWVVPSALSGTGTGISGTTAYIYLTGGQPGITYLVQNAIWSNSGVHEWTGFEVGVK